MTSSRRVLFPEVAASVWGPPCAEFALRSPRRPNPIGLTVVRLLRVEGNALTVAGLDAWDGTLVLDIKPHG